LPLSTELLTRLQLQDEWIVHSLLVLFDHLYEM
jgi:hypothetical protein